MEELKKCPFCGGEAALKASIKEIGFVVWCECKKCHAKTDGYCTDMNNDNKILGNIDNCRKLATIEWNGRYEDEQRNTF